MINPISPISKPNRVTYRLTDVGSHPNFRLPFPGWWAVTGIGGGGGSGATHSGYVDPSEHGYNGALANFGYTWVRQINTTVSIGAGGAGGTATNNSTVAPQRGVSGGSTDIGTATRSGGNGGKCAFEQTGLSPTQPTAIYPVNTYDSRAISVSPYLGVISNIASVTNSAGRGAAGKSSPGQNGDAGSNGRVDWYNLNMWG